MEATVPEGLRPSDSVMPEKLETDTAPELSSPTQPVQQAERNWQGGATFPLLCKAE